eukprot:TRINITY_DN1767_c0_g1_i6.p1 TRINITY_DN1767_c0_g1~~TRINITY_DN1767_c0_g1_i6.p1  ORF type:complete len:487 (-),score=112.22 TRINITY_DN1767_c0_g1_i6:61-1521(-)
MICTQMVQKYISTSRNQIIQNQSSTSIQIHRQLSCFGQQSKIFLPIEHFHRSNSVSYTHLRAHETGRNLVCRLLLEKKKVNFDYSPKKIEDSLTLNLRNLVIIYDKNSDQFQLLNCSQQRKKASFLKDECQELHLKINYQYYQPSSSFGASSGAYIFRPEGDKQLYSKTLFQTLDQGQTGFVITTYKEDLVSTIWFSNENDAPIEVETHLYQIETQYYSGKEIVINFQTDLDNEKKFYTDDNGLLVVERELEKREGFEFHNREFIAGNYFPVTSAIYIQDKKQNVRLLVLNDRAQGGSSLQKGQIELMLNRKTVQDDAKGLFETLNEIDPSTGKGIHVYSSHYVFFEKADKNHYTQRYQQMKIDNPLYLIGISNSNERGSSFKDKLNQVVNDFNKVKLFDELNKNINDLTKFFIRIYHNKEILIRAQNLNEDENLELNLLEKIDKEILYHLVFGNNQNGGNAQWEEKSLTTIQNMKAVYELSLIHI